jgi:transposase-like protein
MTREQKGEWADKTANKLGISPGTLRSWIGGQFSVALKS